MVRELDTYVVLQLSKILFPFGQAQCMTLYVYIILCLICIVSNHNW